jgi:hypothetical protein
MIYSYHADSSRVELTVTGALSIPFIEWVRYWTSIGSTIGCLSEEWDEQSLQFYVTFFKLPSLALGNVEKLCFELPNNVGVS